jgi:hypothetical protein
MNTKISVLENANAKCVSKRVTLYEQVSVITENYRALDVGLLRRPEQVSSTFDGGYRQNLPLKGSQFAPPPNLFLANLGRIGGRRADLSSRLVSSRAQLLRNAGKIALCRQTPVTAISLLQIVGQ